MRSMYSSQTKYHVIVLVVITTLLFSILFVQTNTKASPTPTSVTIAGSFQSELGCAGDWQPDCSSTNLVYDSNDDVWQGTWSIPAGGWEYKAALNGTWDENYGLHAQQNGANISLNLGDATSVKFYYDDKSHWITDNRSSVIAVAPGSFQSELGCSGDWDPSCLRSWLQDIDGDGMYNFETTALVAGNYEAKVAINETWDENYGQGGVPSGANIPFTVWADHVKVTFTYDVVSHILTIFSGHAQDNNVEWDGLRHDSRDTLYRTPGGAVSTSTPVTLRFRTFHNDVTEVKMRVYSVNDGKQKIYQMNLVAADESCYQAGLEGETCDYWAYTLPNDTADNLWYRFIINDGTAIAYYADDTQALDGGLGSPTADLIDNSFALMVYESGFITPSWAKNAVIYQIFPDRFRNGRSNNDPETGQPRYDDPVLSLPWGTLPEGFCRNYDDASTNCPWRFDLNPPSWSPTIESPRGRDYMAGDLKGVDQNLEYLQSLGVNTIYFNPIFDSASNHGYDTQDYYTIDPYFGTQKDWENLVKHASRLGIRIILDGVFNHLSSDSPFFDRYRHYSTVGACESLTSEYRDWFTFHDVAPGTGPCTGSAGAESATYDGWFGFDTIPVINKSNPDVQAYFLTDPNSVSRYWLELGASGWRMDVMGDASFPDGYWETFRDVVQSTNSDALIIGELWQKDTTLLRDLRGDRADTTMNYRLRDAVLGLLTLGPYDSKGFADSGRILEPSEFASRMSSIQEDYPDVVLYSLMNLLDSHDTERILWSLTPGNETTADKEQNMDNLSEGKQRQQIASLIQFTVPGAPTIFYGDEVGQTGDDDPDDRRTYPWADKGGQPDQAMFTHYQTLSSLRQQNSVLIEGDLRMLLADDSTETVAYGRKTGSQAAIVAINRSNISQSVDIDVTGYLPDDTSFQTVYTVANPTGWNASVTNGTISITLNPLSAVLLMTGSIDLTAPDAPSGLNTTEDNGQVGLSWNGSIGAVGYNIYRSPLTGGGYMRVNPSPVSGTSFTDTGLLNARYYFYVVTALDGVGNESAYSNEVPAMPHYTIDWANLQWPSSMVHTISVINRTNNAYGQVYIDGITNQPGATPTLRAQLGFGPSGTNPDDNSDWSWVDASFNVDAGNNDEFMASMLPDSIGVFDYAYRYTTTDGRDWLYADLDGTDNGYSKDQAGDLTVVSSGDTTLPAVPDGLYVAGESPIAIELEWNAILGDPTLYGYEVLRSDTSGGPYAMIARVTDQSYIDNNVNEGDTYYYVVRSIDLSFNRSSNSNEVQATAELRTVTVTFNVTVPPSTPSGSSVFIVGTLDRFDGNLPVWDPGGVLLTQVDDTHWVITLTGLETTQIEYKYTLGSWDFVEKGASCDELANRTLTLNFGSSGTQIVNDTVLNWRNVAPCGD
jgi:glycosidase